MPPYSTQRPTSRTRDTGPPRTGADEKATLRGFLDHLRDAIANKAAGVPEPQVRAAGVPSGTNLLGLVKHLTFVERLYFLGEDVDDWGQTMRPSPEDTIESVLAGYRQAIVRANRSSRMWTRPPAEHSSYDGVMHSHVCARTRIEPPLGTGSDHAIGTNPSRKGFG